MKIGFCYDTKSDYGLEESNLEYTDFVSLHTVSEIAKAIERCGYEVGYIGNAQKLNDLINTSRFPYDMIFNIAEGFGSRNRETFVPGLAELHQIPCTASDVYGMAINMNKYHTKILVRSLGIPTPKEVYFTSLDSSVLQAVRELGYPFVLKPNGEGGSMGLSLIQTEEEFIQKATTLIEQYTFDLLAEEYIEGSEVTVPIIGNGSSAQALGVVTILNEDLSDISLYDNTLKYNDNVINSIDFQYSDTVRQNLLNYSTTIHRFFDLRDYSRMDFRIRPDGSIYFLEINAMPSLCRGCSFEQCGKAMGLEYHEIIGKIIGAARQRYA